MQETSDCFDNLVSGGSSQPIHNRQSKSFKRHALSHNDVNSFHIKLPQTGKQAPSNTAQVTSASNTLHNASLVRTGGFSRNKTPTFACDRNFSHFRRARCEQPSQINRQFLRRLVTIFGFLIQALPDDPLQLWRYLRVESGRWSWLPVQNGSNQLRVLHLANGRCPVAISYRTDPAA